MTKRRRILRVILIVGAALLALRLALGLAASLWLDAKTDALLEKHGSLRPRASAPPEVPGSENAAVLHLAASLQFDGDNQADRFALRRFVDERKEGDTPTSDEQMRDIVSRYALALRLMDEALTKPATRWKYGYEGITAEIPNLIVVMDLGRLLLADMKLALTDGDDERAATRFREALQLSSGLIESRVMIMTLIGTALERGAIRTLREELIHRDRVSESILGVARAELERLPDATSAYDEAIVYEMRSVHAVLRGLAAGSDETLDDTWLSLRPLVWLARPWVMWNHGHVLDRFEALERRLRAPIVADESLEEERSASKLLWLRDLLAPSLSGVLERERFARGHRALARAALAVEEHRLRHGSPPASLTELADAAGEVSFTDPWTGELLSYEILPTGGYRLATAGAARPVTVRPEALQVWERPR